MHILCYVVVIELMEKAWKTIHYKSKKKKKILSESSQFRYILLVQKISFANLVKRVVNIMIRCEFVDEFNGD